MITPFKSLPQLYDYFKDDQTCKEYLAKQRWPQGVKCPHCSSDKIYTTNRGYKCSNKTCLKKFTVTTGTMYENTKISLRTWFAAMYILTSYPKGLSSNQLAKDLDITLKAAWYLTHRIRQMIAEKQPQKLAGVIQADESAVGGKNKNRHKDKKVKHSQGRSHKDKTWVLGLVQQEKKGQSRLIVVPNTSKKVLHPLVKANIEKKSILVTDDYTSYSGLNKNFTHVVVKDKTDNYKSKEGYNTNKIEGLWNILKKMHNGTYHQMSRKHLQKYCDELQFRYNRMDLTNYAKFEEAVGSGEGMRLKYKDLIGTGSGKKRIKKVKQEENINEKIEQDRFRLEAEFRSNISG